MKPARYFPKKTRTKSIIDNLAYAMNCMLEKQSACRDGIGFVACMDDWGMNNFDVKYWFKFMMALQGEVVPVRVQLFLIVNPPSWFGAVLRVMKPMLAPEFQKKVKIIKEEKLSTYLQSGYKDLLPDDMKSGRASTDALVHEFIRTRKNIEKNRPADPATGGAEEDGHDCDEDLGEDLDSSESVQHDLVSLSHLGNFYMDGNDAPRVETNEERISDPLGLEQDILSFLSQNDAITDCSRPYD
jgi:hypothetical protein